MLKYAAMAMAISALPVSAEPLTGNQLLTICGDDTDLSIPGAAYCMGFIEGTIGGIEWGTSFPLFADGGDDKTVYAKRDAILGFCLPDGATVAQYRDISVKFLRDRPEQRHKSAIGLIHMAMREAFPCD